MPALLQCSRLVQGDITSGYTWSLSKMLIVAVSAAPLVMPWEAVAAEMVRTAEKVSVISAMVSFMIGMDTLAVVSPTWKVVMYDPPV